jgi:hypothetical protein
MARESSSFSMPRQTVVDLIKKQLEPASDVQIGLALLASLKDSQLKSNIVNV